MSELIVRKGVAEDAAAVAELEQLCFAVPWSRESIIRDLTENELAEYIVAELDGRIVGYVGLWVVVDEGHINNVAVSPAFRRRHIAAALIEAVLRFAENAGVKGFTLEVRTGNEPARRLYEKFGFQQAGVRKGYYEDNGEDAVIMWRR